MSSMKTTIDQDTFTITFKRSFAAPRDDVFDAWTDPERIKLWWDPTGAPLASCSVDLRPGGSFRFVNASHHGPPFAGVYSEIDRPARLVFDAMGALGTVLLEGDDDTTNMTVTIRCSSAQHLDQFVKLGVATGTDQTLDNLVAHVKRHKKAS